MTILGLGRRTSCRNGQRQKPRRVLVEQGNCKHPGKRHVDSCWPETVYSVTLLEHNKPWPVANDIDRTQKRREQSEEAASARLERGHSEIDSF